MKRKKIAKQIQVDIDLNTTLDNLIKSFIELKDQYGEDAEFEISLNDYDFYDYDLQLTYYREEIDNEFYIRLAKNKQKQITRKANAEKKRLQKIESEKKLLKELQEKYGTDLK